MIHSSQLLLCQGVPDLCSFPCCDQNAIGWRVRSGRRQTPHRLHLREDLAHRLDGPITLKAGTAFPATSAVAQADAHDSFQSHLLPFHTNQYKGLRICGTCGINTIQEPKRAKSPAITPTVVGDGGSLDLVHDRLRDDLSPSLTRWSPRTLLTNRVPEPGAVHSAGFLPQMLQQPGRCSA